MTHNGTIKNIVEARGFGFISMAGGPDVFFHVRDLSDGLEFDEQLTERRVQFELADTPKGPRAVNVRPQD